MRPGSLGTPQARRRPAGARDRRPGRPRRGASAPSASAAAGGSARTRSACAADAPLRFPRRRVPVAPPRRRGHRSDLAVRDAPVGVARRPAAAAPRGHRRRRVVGHRRWRSCSRARVSRSSSAAAPPSRPSSWRSVRENARYLPGVESARGRQRHARGRPASSPRMTSSASPCPPARCPPRSPPIGPAVPGARERARPFQGPRAAAGNAAQRVRRRAGARARRGLPGWPRPRRRGAPARRRARRRLARRSLRAPARRRAVRGRPATSRRAPT